MMPSQVSLTDQVEAVLELATNRGYYDAADWIKRAFYGKLGKPEDYLEPTRGEEES